MDWLDLLAVQGTLEVRPSSVAPDPAESRGWRRTRGSLRSSSCLGMRVPGTARRSNQSILKEISPEYSLEGLMLKLKLQYFGHLIQRTNSLEKTLGWEMVKDREAWCAAGHGVAKSQIQLSD